MIKYIHILNDIIHLYQIGTLLEKFNIKAVVI